MRSIYSAIVSFFMSYVGIKGAEKKFLKLINNHAMVPLSYDIQNRNWDHLETTDVRQLNGY